jgi:hypothetical protein
MTYKTLNSEELAHVLSATSPHSFQFNIARMHDVYGLPKNTAPTLDPALIGEDPVTRLDKFVATIESKLHEYSSGFADGRPSIRRKVIEATARPPENPASHDALTDIADWLADLSVYCRSEAMKFGLPHEDVQDAVLGANLTRSSINPPYDENGKFQSRAATPSSPSVKTILFSTTIRPKCTPPR